MYIVYHGELHSDDGDCRAAGASEEKYKKVKNNNNATWMAHTPHRSRSVGRSRLKPTAYDGAAAVALAAAVAGVVCTH